MRYVFLVLALAPVVLLVVGRLRGHETVAPCCPPPELDGRVSGALAEETAREVRSASPGDAGAVR